MIHRICLAANEYKQNLDGKQFLILFEGEYIEVTFKKEHFLHLCGVGTKLFSKDFYKKSANYSLTKNEIIFNSVHPYDLADIKTNNLNTAFNIFRKESLIVTDITTHTYNYKLGATDLDILICFDYDRDKNGNKTSDVLIPYSLRVENIANSKYNKIYEIDYVLSKCNGSKSYTKIEFGEVSQLQQYLTDKNLTGFSINISN